MSEIMYSVEKLIFTERFAKDYIISLFKGYI